MRAARVGDVDQLVGGDGEAEPGAGLGAVVELDPLVQPVAEQLLREHAVRRTSRASTFTWSSRLTAAPRPM